MYKGGEFGFERPNWEQALHDMTLQKVADNLKRKGLNVRTNKDRSGNNVIKQKNKRVSPDICIIKNRKIINIYEVETNNTVNSSAIEKWRLCSEGCVSFYLIIPEGKLKASKKLAKKHKINVKDFITYNLNK